MDYLSEIVQHRIKYYVHSHCHSHCHHYICLCRTVSVIAKMAVIIINVLFQRNSTA